MSSTGSARNVRGVTLRTGASALGPLDDELCAKLQDEQTFVAVQREREVLDAATGQEAHA